MRHNVVRRLVAPLLLLLSWALPASAQEGRGQVTGTVVHADTKEPMAGVQVYLEGTRHSAVTTQNGRFLILNVEPGIYRIVASNIGYAEAFKDNVRVEAGAPVTVNFEMRAEALSIEGLVVTGVVDPISGIKVPFTVGRISAEDMPVPANTSAAGIIQGKIAGAQVVRAHSPGSGVYIQLRSPTSIYGSNGPLYVVDGVILSNAFDRTTVDIESLDIESVEVIKGAAAASLYGSRANNGVISITTKRGSEIPQGQTRITARSEFGFNQIAKRIPIARHHYFLTNEEGYLVNSSGAVLENPLSGRVTAPDRIMDNPWGPYKTYDNVDRFFKAGQFRGNTFTISQNSSSTNFSLSFNNYQTTGTLEGNDGFERNSFRVNLDHRPRNDLSVRIGAYHMRSFRDNVVGEPFEDLLRFLPDVDLATPGENGIPYKIEPAAPYSSIRNPLYWQWANDNWEKRARTQANIALRYSPIRWLTLDADLGYDRSDRLIQEYRAKGMPLLESNSDGDDPDVDGGINGRYRIYMAQTNSYTASFTATLLNSFGPLTARTYYRGIMEREDQQNLNAIGRQLAVTGTKDLSVSTDRLIDSGIILSRANGHMVATALDYNDKYIADFLIRRDGSSRFGPESRWQTYYRAAVNWRVSQEPWFNVPGVSEFQIRFSRGTAGGRPSYEWQYETYTITEAGLLQKGTLGNRFLRPEKTTENDLTIRTIFDNRISVDLTYVTTKTEDQVLPVALPGPYGFNTQRRNAGTIVGTTYEATIEARLINRNNLSWRTNLVLDRSRNRVERFDRPCYRENMVFYCEGMVMGEFWTTRLHRKPEELLYRHSPEVLSQFQVNDDGLLVWVGEGNTYKDGLSKNLWGTQTTIDGFTYQWGLPFQQTNEIGNPVRVKTGDGNPDLNFGWSNTVRWKRFTFYAHINGQLGGDIYNTTRARMYTRYRHGDVDQYGKPEELKKPIDYYNALYNSGNFVDFFIEDGSYAKLSELSVRYNLRQNQMKGVLRQLGLQNLSLGLIGRNVYTLTRYTGYDPEVGSNFNRRDANPYPPYRTITGEIRVTF